MRLALTEKPTTLHAVAQLSFFQRLALGWRSFFRVLGDSSFAEKILALDAAAPELSEAKQVVAKGDETLASEAGPVDRAAREFPAEHTALQLLNLLQREGRLIDFLQQDVTRFSDVQIGQAARVVHDGCRATLRRYVDIEPVLGDGEGEFVIVDDGFDPQAIKLLGNVAGQPPFRGVLRHQGWRVCRIDLPETVGAHDFFVLAPAEVEL